MGGRGIDRRDGEQPVNGIHRGKGHALAGEGETPEKVEEKPTFEGAVWCRRAELSHDWKTHPRQSQRGTRGPSREISKGSFGGNCTRKGGKSP